MKINVAYYCNIGLFITQQIFFIEEAVVSNLMYYLILIYDITI